MARLAVADADTGCMVLPDHSGLAVQVVQLSIYPVFYFL